VIEDSDSGGNKKDKRADEVTSTGLSVIFRKNKLKDRWGEEEDGNDFLDGLESTHH
jgi:hypothetical protein